MFNKLIKLILSITLIFGWLTTFNTTFAQPIQGDYTYDFPIPDGSLVTDTPTCYWEDCTEFIYEIPVDENDSIMGQLLSLFWLNNAALSWDHKFIKYVRWILNMALWLLSMIALVMTIYTFYMMFFTENEAWAKKARQNLVGIFIALAIIWLAWLIVSFIFWRYQSKWQNAL